MQQCYDMTRDDVLYDAQRKPPVGSCARCGGELYHRDETFCPACADYLKSNSALLAYVKEYPQRALEVLEDFTEEDFLSLFWDTLRGYLEFSDEHGPSLETWAETCK